MFWHLILLLLGLLLFFGGLGVKVALVQYLGALVGLVLILALVWKKRFKVPSSIGLYLLFLLALTASTIWNQGRRLSLEYLVLFVGGGFFWLVFYNLKEKLRDGILWVVIFLGLAFAELFVINQASGEKVFGYQSLFLPNTIYLQHNHLGDFWAVVLVAVTYFLLRGKKWWTWSLIGLGGYFLLVSLSRSGYVALAVGISYLFTRGEWLAKYRKVLWFFLGLTLALSLFVGTTKTTLFSRPYFVQAVFGFMRNPWGVGVGNFYIISSDPANQLLGMQGLSGFTHNLVLEFMVGMGFLGLIFVAWLTRVMLSLWQDKDPQNLPFQAIFITLGVNFLFDYTYIIPTMVWLWFMVLGLSSKEGWQKE